MTLKLRVVDSFMEQLIKDGEIGLATTRPFLPGDRINLIWSKGARTCEVVSLLSGGSSSDSSVRKYLLKICEEGE